MLLFQHLLIAMAEMCKKEFGQPRCADLQSDPTWTSLLRLFIGLCCHLANAYGN